MTEKVIDDSIFNVEIALDMLAVLVGIIGAAWTIFTVLDNTVMGVIILGSTIFSVVTLSFMAKLIKLLVEIKNNLSG